MKFAVVLMMLSNLSVRVDGVRNDRGVVLVSLYDQAEGFPRDRDAVLLTQKVVASKGSVHVHFGELAPGEYAIAVLHDENESGDMDSNFIGLPKEGYGFSNDVKPKLKAPSFDDTKFRVDGDETEVVLEMRY